MRDVTIIEEFKRVQNLISYIAQQFRLALTGESLQNETIKKILIDKGITTEEDFTKALGEVIQKHNSKPAPAEEEKKPEIATPTPDQVNAVEQSKLQ